MDVMEYPKLSLKMRTRTKIKKKDAFNTGDEFPPCFLRLSANYKQNVFNIRLSVKCVIYACCYLNDAILGYLKVILKVNEKIMWESCSVFALPRFLPLLLLCTLISVADSMNKFRKYWRLLFMNIPKSHFEIFLVSLRWWDMRQNIWTK